MSNTSIINLISQSTTAIAGAAGQTQRFSELVTQSYPAGVTLRFPEVIDRVALAADSCEIKLDDRDSKISFPRKGDRLTLSLGWQGSGLTVMGHYTIDEIELTGPPRTVTLRGTSTAMAGTAKNSHAQAWEQVTLSQIVQAIAARQGWIASCPIETLWPALINKPFSPPIHRHPC